MKATSKGRKEAFLDMCLPVPYCGCWLWLGSGTQAGYGHFYFNGKVQLAHRASHEIFKSAIPLRMLVCHRCDTPSCVNPDHLFVGTHADNASDKFAKDRGERNPVVARINRSKTHCNRGHMYSPENTRISSQNDRICRTCESARLWYRRMRLKMPLSLELYENAQKEIV